MTDQQKLFIDAYFLNNCNASRAAEVAGYVRPHSQAGRLKADPEIAAEIKHRLDENGMSANEVLSRLADHARVDIADYWDFGTEETEEQKQLRREFPRAMQRSPTAPVMDLRKAKAAGKTPLLKSIEISDEGGVKIAVVDSQAALTTLARFHKLLTDKVDLTSGGEKIKGYIGFAPEDV